MRKEMLLILLAVVLLVSACGSGDEVATAPPLAPSAAPTEPVVAVTAESTPAAGGEVAATGTLTLTMPAGDPWVVPVIKCQGLLPGEYLDMHATNTLDLAAADRVDVQVGGVHQGPGQPANLYIAVTIGSVAAPVFMGNTPAAPVEILSEADGRFVGVPIVNVYVGSPSYEFNKEYPITGEWHCGP